MTAKFCDFCNGVSHDGGKTDHEEACPLNPDNIPPNEPVASNLRSIGLARANRGAYPGSVPAMAALDLARDWVRESGINPDHVIVFLASQQPDGADGIKFFQSGSYRPHAQTGMIHAGLDMMHGSGFAGYGE